MYNNGVWLALYLVHCIALHTMQSNTSIRLKYKIHKTFYVTSITTMKLFN